jgi:VanZ family protein
MLAPVGAVGNPRFGFNHWDSVSHLVIYGITSFVCAWSASFFKTLFARTLFGFILDLSLVLVTAGFQHFVGRHRDFFDLLADVAGLSLGLLMYVLFELRPEHRHGMG